MCRVLLLLFALVLSASAQKLSTTYDKFKDVTTIRAKDAEIVGSPKGGYVRFNVLARYPGQTKATPDHVLLVFQSHSREWRFLRSNMLILLVDGEAYDVGRPTRDSGIDTGRYTSGVWEHLYYRLPIGDAERIAKATNVEMQLGPMEAKWKPDNIAILREVVNAVR